MSERMLWRIKVASFAVFASVILIDWVALKPETLHSLVADYHLHTFSQAFVSEKISKPLEGQTVVSVDVDAVNVDVSVSDESDAFTIELEGRMPAVVEGSHLSMDATEGRVSFRVREWPETFWIRKFGFANGIEARIVLKLPKRFSGELLFASKSGTLGIDKASLAKLEARTKSGSVYVTGSDVHHMRIETFDGNVMLGVRSQDVVVETDRGDVQASFYDAPETGRSNLEFRSLNGDLNIFVDPQSSLAVSIESVAGQVTSPFGHTNKMDMRERKFVGNLGTGQGVLSAKTWSGSIVLEAIKTKRP